MCVAPVQSEVQDHELTVEMRHEEDAEYECV
jgi:hypothetical protein